MTSTVTTVEEARGGRVLSARPELLALGALVILAAAVRFVGLGAQSMWLDEWLTHGYTGMGLHDLGSALVHYETHPPLYFVFVWAWTHVFGTDEAGMRSMSAVVGTASVPLAYAAARARFSTRDALLAAALVAVNPFSVWYAQEARPYALLEALCLASLVCVIRAADGGGRRWLWGWAVTASLALLTQYFAAFVIAAEAAWLLTRRRGRAELGALAGIGIVALLLLPHLLNERSKGEWVHVSNPLSTRISLLPVQFLTGLWRNWDQWADTEIRFIAAAALCAVALVLAVAWRRERVAAWPFLLVAASVVLVPLAVAIVKPSSDYFLPRYLIPALAPLLIVVAAGLAARRSGVLGLACGVVLAGLFLSMTVSIATRTQLQRPDWRDVGRTIGTAPRARAVITTFNVQAQPLLVYTPHLTSVYVGGTKAFAASNPADARKPITASELIYVGFDAGPHARHAAPAPGFRLTGRTKTPGYLVLTYTSTRPLHTTAGQLAATAPKVVGYPLTQLLAPAVYVQRPG